MKVFRFRPRLLLAGVVASLLAAPTAHAQYTVFDPSNYSQNVMTAARALQQINNQIQSLQNQAVMLVNQARNLTNLPYSALSQFDASIGQTVNQLSQAQRIPYSASAIDQSFSQTYPLSYGGSASATQMQADAQARWQNALAGYQDAMRVQAGAVGNLDSTRSQINALVGSSQAATGALQASQSGNQLNALQTKQLADLTAVLASLARAQSLDGASQVASKAQAQQQLQNFLNYGGGYQSAAAQMFH